MVNPMSLVCINDGQPCPLDAKCVSCWKTLPEGADRGAKIRVRRQVMKKRKNRR